MYPLNLNINSESDQSNHYEDRYDNQLKRSFSNKKLSGFLYKRKSLIDSPIIERELDSTRPSYEFHLCYNYPKILRYPWSRTITMKGVLCNRANMQYDTKKIIGLQSLNAGNKWKSLLSNDRGIKNKDEYSLNYPLMVEKIKKPFCNSFAGCKNI
ncbi:unnamed protein product [Gordionus sp. m RMFG-2023]